MTLEYDANGKLWKVKDWASPQTVVTYTYDTSGRLWKVTDVMGGEVEYTYDTNGRMLTVARLITAGQPKVTLVTNVYNANGRVTQQTDAEGRVTTYRQYENGPLWETLYPLGSSKPGVRLLVRDSYDANNRLSSQYREYDRLIQEGGDQVEEETLSWTYNADAFPVTFDRAGKLWRMCYDVDYAGAAIGGSRGNLTRLIAPSPSSGAARPTSLYTYDTKNNPTKLVPPKGVASTANDTCTTNLNGTTGDPPLPIVNNDHATDLVYDGSQKKLLSITKRFHDPPPSGPLKTATWKYEYTSNDFPELVTRVTPPNGNTGANPDPTYSTDFEHYGPGSGTDTGLLWIVRDPYDKEVKYTCDAVG
jgi:YD repeat-containing protein